MIKIAYINSAKFAKIENARIFLENAKNTTSILLGDNGLFLVPATNREESILVKAGYERMV